MLVGTNRLERDGQEGEAKEHHLAPLRTDAPVLLDPRLMALPRLRDGAQEARGAVGRERRQPRLRADQGAEGRVRVEVRGQLLRVRAEVVDGLRVPPLKLGREPDAEKRQPLLVLPLHCRPVVAVAGAVVPEQDHGGLLLVQRLQEVQQGLQRGSKWWSMVYGVFLAKESKFGVQIPTFGAQKKHFFNTSARLTVQQLKKPIMATQRQSMCSSDCKLGGKKIALGGGGMAQKPICPTPPPPPAAPGGGFRPGLPYLPRWEAGGVATPKKICGSK